MSCPSLIDMLECYMCAISEATSVFGTIHLHVSCTNNARKSIQDLVCAIIAEWEARQQVRANIS